MRYRILCRTAITSLLLIVMLFLNSCIWLSEGHPSDWRRRNSLAQVLSDYEKNDSIVMIGEVFIYKQDEQILASSLPGQPLYATSDALYYQNLDKTTNTIEVYRTDYRFREKQVLVSGIHYIDSFVSPMGLYMYDTRYLYVTDYYTQRRYDLETGEVVEWHPEDRYGDQHYSESYGYAYKSTSQKVLITRLSDGATKRIYTYDGTQLVREELRSASTNATVGYIYYYYDASGTAYGFFYRTADQSYTENFYYRRNLQGEITGILNSSGVQLATYTYSPYGMLVNTSYDASVTANARTAIDASSLRYKGYYYDAGTGFYYLQSRYYDPKVGRFISADWPDVLTGAPTALTDKNLFAYCDNNPIMRTDEDGEAWNALAGAPLYVLATLSRLPLPRRA